MRIASRLLISLLRNQFCPVTWAFGNWNGNSWCKVALYSCLSSSIQRHHLAFFFPDGFLILSSGIPSFHELLSLCVTDMTKLISLFSLISDRAAFSISKHQVHLHSGDRPPLPTTAFLEKIISFSQSILIGFCGKNYISSTWTFISFKKSYLLFWTTTSYISAKFFGVTSLAERYYYIYSLRPLNSLLSLQFSC